MKKIILIGAGNRGAIYTDIGARMEDAFEVVAVAEPNKARRDYIKNKHNIPDEMCFESWEPLLDMPKFADVALIATMDKDHFGPAMAAIDKGYDLLLEKPISPSPEECIAIKKAAEEKGVLLMVCFVLRYTPFFNKLKQLLDEGVIGDVVTIQHAEDVGNIHQSHSFVRGNWGNSEKSSFMLLQKCSHDMDILQWLIGKPCKRVSSFGSLSYFKRENAPEGAPEYCIDGCPHGEDCLYNAVDHYLKSDLEWFRSMAAQKPQPSDDEVAEALRTTQYGKCVFKCDNNVVDHQVVNMEFEDGVTVTFSMAAFNRGNRSIRIMGTKGTITGDMDKNRIEVYQFDKNRVMYDEEVRTSVITPKGDGSGGHGGGDNGLMRELHEVCESEDKPTGDAFNSAINHIVTFAAEHSRVTGKVVDIEEYTAELLRKIEK